MFFNSNNPVLHELAIALKDHKDQFQQISKEDAYSKATLLDAKFLDIILDASKDLVVLYDTDGKILYGKGSLRGLSVNFERKKPYDLYGEKQGDKIIEKVKSVINEKIAVIFETPMKVGGERFVMKHFCYPIIYNSDEVLGALCISKDISNENSEIEFLAQSNDFLQGIFNHVQMGICLTDSKGYFYKVNPSYTRIYGFSEEELIGKHFTTIVPEIGKAFASDMHDKFIGGMPEIPDEWEVQHKDGSTLYVFADAILLENEIGEKFKLTTVIDITERKLLAIKLEEERQRLRQIMNLGRLGSFEFDLKNKRWENIIFLDRVLGIGAEKEHLSEQEYIKFFAAEKWSEFYEITKGLLAEQPSSIFEQTLFDVTGNPIDVVILLKRQEAAKDRVFVIVQDVSNLKLMQKQLQKQNDALLESNNKLNLFLKVLSHDLRSPLNSAQGLVSLLKMDATSSQSELLDPLELSLGKMNLFIDDLLTMAQTQFEEMELELETVDMNMLVTSVVDTHRFDIEYEKVQFQFDMKQEVPFRSVKNYLNIILNNLISNGYKYHDPRKDASYINVNIIIDAKSCIITVEDNGLGIPKDALDKIFDLMYVVTKQAKSTGIGLHLVKELVERMKGKLGVESEFGKGTTFMVVLPNTAN